MTVWAVAPLYKWISPFFHVHWAMNRVCCPSTMLYQGAFAAWIQTNPRYSRPTAPWGIHSLLSSLWLGSFTSGCPSGLAHMFATACHEGFPGIDFVFILYGMPRTFSRQPTTLTYRDRLIALDFYHAVFLAFEF